MGLLPHHSSTYGDRAIAVPQILRDFTDFADAKMAHQIARLVRFRIYRIITGPRTVTSSAPSMVIPNAID
jgi:hypothetical protein